MAATGKCLKCPKCGALYSWPTGTITGLKCTACLMDRVEMVALVPVEHKAVRA